jgi:hypothetical protein
VLNKKSGMTISFQYTLEIRSSETSVNPGSTQRHIPETFFIVTAVKTSNLTKYMELSMYDVTVASLSDDDPSSEML